MIFLIKRENFVFILFMLIQKILEEQKGISAPKSAIRRRKPQKAGTSFTQNLQGETL
jgi:hypothetical protein